MKRIFFASLAVIIFIIIPYYFTEHPFLFMIFFIALYFFVKELVYFLSKETPEAAAPPAALKYTEGTIATFNGACIEFIEDGKTIALWRRERSGRVISREGRTINGSIMSYCRFGGNLRGKAYVKFSGNNFADDSIVWMRPNGARYMECEIDREGVYSGKYASYYFGGGLEKKAWFSEGLIVGKVEKYYPSGLVMERTDHKKGVKDGLRVEYYDDASNNIKRTSSFLGGKLTGYMREYYRQNGNKAAEYYYKNNAKMMETVYGEGGLITRERISRELEKDILNTDELKGMRRRIRANLKLAKYGMEMYDPNSDVFPRIRAIRRPGMYIIREFSCEEELIKFVLSGKFKILAKQSMEDASKKPVVMVFTPEGKLVREKH